MMSEIEQNIQNKTACENSSALDYYINNQITNDDIIDNFSFYERKLYLYSEITQKHSEFFLQMIDFWNKIDDMENIPKDKRIPIKIYINTPGGDLTATLSIIDAILLSRTPVWTIVSGKAYSGGFFISIVGHHRIGYPNSIYLFHEGFKECEGDAHKCIEELKFYQRLLKRIKKIVLKHTKIDKKLYKNKKKDDFWMLAEDALKLSVIDEITTTLI